MPMWQSFWSSTSVTVPFLMNRIKKVRNFSHISFYKQLINGPSVWNKDKKRSKTRAIMMNFFWISTSGFFRDFQIRMNRSGFFHFFLFLRQLWKIFFGELFKNSSSWWFQRHPKALDMPLEHVDIFFFVILNIYNFFSTTCRLLKHWVAACCLRESSTFKIYNIWMIR